MSNSPQLQRVLGLVAVAPGLLEWLLTAVLVSSQRQRWLIVDLLRANALFPFDLGENAAIILHRSNRFEVVREGLDQEMVGLSAVRVEESGYGSAA
jgi:hypothetical protein